MPSGAKKRKAAKKKKAHHHHHSHEHDDLRHHEEKDSDGGETEVLSPASQGHGDHFPNDGSEELENPPPTRSVDVSESKSSELDPVDSVGASKFEFEEIENLEIVNKVKSEDDPKSQAANIECIQVEAVEMPANGSEEKSNQEDILECNAVNIECVQAEAVEISANGCGEKSNSVGFDNGSQVIKKKVDQKGVETVVLETSHSNDSEKKAISLPEVLTQNVENFLSVDSVELMPSVSEKLSHVSETLVEERLADCALTLKDPDEKVTPLIDETSRLPLKNIDKAANVISNEIAGKSLSDEKEGKCWVNPEVSVAQNSDIVQTAKEPERPRLSENQPPVAPALKLQRTSWFSCCGIFDVITGSSR